MIVDSHVHLGYDVVFEKHFTEIGVLNAMADNDVDAVLVQPGTVMFLEGVREQHDAIAHFVEAHPDRAFGIANPNPHLPLASYREELVRCVRSLGFVGVKINTLAHAVSISGTVAQGVYALAQELGVPVIIHTGPGHATFSPLAAIPMAHKYPDLRLVLAHAGNAWSGEEALLAAETCSNIVLETSWAKMSFVRAAIQRLGARRLMFGSDHPENVAVEIAKHKVLGLSADDLHACLGDTAARVFRLPDRGQTDR